MNHATRQQWQDYVEGKLEAAQHEVLEHHLYECDKCLELYMSAIDTSIVSDYTDPHLPVLDSEAASTAADRIMAAIHNKGSLYQSNKRVPLIRHPLFQYTVAAAITMLLLSTGVFHNITKLTESRHHSWDPVNSTQIQPEESFSQRLMEKTTVLLDNLHSNRKVEGGQLDE